MVLNEMVGLNPKKSTVAGHIPTRITQKFKDIGFQIL